MKTPFLYLMAYFLVGALTVSAQDMLAVYPVDPSTEAYRNEDFSIRVKTPGGAWHELFAFTVKVDQVVGTGHAVQKASMASFDFEGKVEVLVTYNKGKIRTARVRPLAYGIVPKVQGNRLSFHLSKPSNLSIEVNGDIFHNLHLFANPLEGERPSPDDPDIIYFSPGVHEIEGGKLKIPSNKTVYLAGGAIVKGQLSLEKVSNVAIRGRGMVDQDVRLGVHIANSQQVSVEGIFASQCLTGGSDDVRITNVKCISYFGWGDGMNVMASNEVVYDRVFNRTSDDSHTVYATRKGFTGGAKNITMKNSTLWADVAHPIMIGIHGNSKSPDTIQHLKYMNIDILDHQEKQVDYQGCLTINAGDNNLIRNVRFEDIRVENFREGQLVNLRIFYNDKYCMAPGKGIEDVVFRNLQYEGDRANLSIIAGYDEDRKVKNITFEDLVINGTLIHDQMEGKPAWYKTSDMAGFFVGEHVEGIQFIKTK